MRKPLVINLAFSGVYFLLAVFLIGVVNVNHAWSKQANVCDGLKGDAYGLCNAYCNGMKCGTDQQKASDTACDMALNKFRAKSGIQFAPCDDPCQSEVLNNTQNECPCNYYDIPLDSPCWGQTSPNYSSGPTFQPCTDANCIGPLLLSSESCSLLTETDILDPATGENAVRGIAATTNLTDIHHNWVCGAGDSDNTGCFGISEGHFFLTLSQLKTCLCRIGQYANDLAQVSGSGLTPVDPPYSCQP